VKDSNSKNEWLKSYARYSSIAIQMVVIIVGGTFAGFGIDSLLEWKFPLFTVLFSLLSVIGAIYLVVKDLLKKK